jgi:hypothetical protein
MHQGMAWDYSRTSERCFKSISGIQMRPRPLWERPLLGRKATHARALIVQRPLE